MNFAIKIISSAASRKGWARWLFTLFGFFVFCCVVGLVIVASFWTDKVLGFSPLPLGRLALPLSAIIGSLGASLTLWSISLFSGAGGTPVPLNPPKRLVVSGPYAYCRNPMLTGLCTTLYGVAIFTQSLSMSIIYIPAFVLFNFFELKLIEEPELEMRLGEDYKRYKDNVPMLFVRLKKYIPDGGS